MIDRFIAYIESERRYSPLTVRNYKRDLEIILEGIKKNIDIIMMNGRPFVYVAAFGNYINVSFDTPKKWKEIFGRLAYFLFGFTEMYQRIRMNKIKYTVDGKTKEGEFSFIFIKTKYC